MPRKMAATFIREAGPNPQELALAQQQAQNDAEMLRQNQAAYGQNPLPYEVSEAMRQYSPDEIDDAVRQLGNDETEVGEGAVELLDENGNMALDIQGQTSDFGSEIANMGGI